MPLNHKEVGRIGGKARSHKKKKSSLRNLVIANRKKKVWRKIKEIEDLIIVNREAWLTNKDIEVRRALDKEFQKLYEQKEGMKFT